MHGGGGWAGSPPALCGSRHTDGSLCMLPSPKNPSEQEAKQIAAGEEKPGLLGVHVLPFILKAITDTRPASCSHYRAFPADYMQPSRAHTTRLCMLALMVGDWRARPQSSSETSFKKKKMYSPSRQGKPSSQHLQGCVQGMQHGEHLPVHTVHGQHPDGRDKAQREGNSKMLSPPVPAAFTFEADPHNAS